MPLEAMQFGLLLSGWVVAFMLGRELHTGYSQWRARVASGTISRGKD